MIQMKKSHTIMKYWLVPLTVIGLSSAPVGAWADAVEGAGVGALGGALAGSLAGPAKNRVDNSLIGAVAGGLLGYAVGNEAEKQGHAMVNQTLEAAPPHTTTTWVNPSNGVTYLVTPEPIYHDRGRICRRVHIHTIVNGHKEIMAGLTCRERHGPWRFVEPVATVVEPMPQTIIVQQPPRPVVVMPPPTVIYEERDPYRHHRRDW